MLIADKGYAHDSTRAALRRLATRYAKRATIYRAGLVLIAAIIWLS